MLAALLVAAALTLPQEPPVPPTADPGPDPVFRLEEVVVEARRLEELTREFVDEVSAPPRNRGLARWWGGVCVAVVNIRAEVAQPLADRISQVAMEYGLRPGDPGCQPNILVTFADDGRALSDAMVERRRRIFRVGVGGLDRGNVALRDFRESDRPVRWWHVSIPTNANTGEAGIRLPGGDAPEVMGEGLVNRGRWIRDDLNKVIIVVDITQIDGAMLPQLADYLALVALAQVDPDGDTSRFETILNLFDDPEGSPGLTGWDRAYLEALYGGPSERIRNSDQTRELLRNLRRAPSTD
jgi:hypothetical protein